MIFTNSTFGTFNKCPHSYDLKYNQNVYLKREHAGPARKEGTLIHLLLNAYWEYIRDDGVFNLAERCKDYIKSYYENNLLTYESREELGKKCDMFWNVIKAYKHNYLEYDAEKYDVLFIEKKLEAKLGDDIYSGFIDLVLKEKDTNKIIIVDHKTFASQRRGYALGQLMSYVWLANQNGIYTNTFMYDYVKKTAPVDPKINKNGSISLDKSQKTTYKLMNETIEKLDPHNRLKYVDVLTNLELNPKFFIREEHVMDKDVLKQWEENALNQIESIHSCKYYKNLGACNDMFPCDYKRYCYAKDESDRERYEIKVRELTSDLEESE